MRLLAIASILAVATCEQLTSTNTIGSMREMLAELKMDSNDHSSGVAKGRRLIIENLLEEVSAFEGAIPAAGKTLLMNARDILTTILNDLMASREALQTHFDTYPGKFHDCDLDTETTRTQASPPGDGYILSGENDNDWNNLTDCWNSMKATETNVTTECNDIKEDIIDNWDQNPNYGDCFTNFIPGGSAETQEFASEWTVHLEDGNAFFTEAKYSTMTAHEGDCRNAMSYFVDRNSDCHTEQAQYQTSACAAWCARESRCETYHDCFGDLNVSVAQEYTDHQQASDQRAVDAQVVSTLRCLIEQLGSQDWDDFGLWWSSCDGNRTPLSQYDPYKNDFPAYNTSGVCNTDDLQGGDATTNGVPGWNYDGIVWVKADWNTQELPLGAIIECDTTC